MPDKKAMLMTGGFLRADSMLEVDHAVANEKLRSVGPFYI